MDEHLETLGHIYNKLKETCIQELDKNQANSILLSLLRMKSKTRRMRLLSESAVPVISINNNILSKLLEARYIELINKRKGVVLTGRGIWQAELRQNICNIEILLEFIEEKWFGVFKDENKPLNDKEKVILFSLLALRAFSKESSIDTARGDEAYNKAVKNIIINLSEFLLNNHIITSSIRNELEGKKLLGTVSHFFRYSEHIPKKTDGLYVALRPNKYFINISDENGQVDIDDLIFLFSKVVEDKLNYQHANLIKDKCVEGAYSMSTNIFDPTKHKFANTKYDDLIEQALRKLL